MPAVLCSAGQRVDCRGARGPPEPLADGRGRGASGRGGGTGTEGGQGAWAPSPLGIALLCPRATSLPRFQQLPLSSPSRFLSARGPHPPRLPAAQPLTPVVRERIARMRNSVEALHQV